MRGGSWGIASVVVGMIGCGKADTGSASDTGLETHLPGDTPTSATPLPTATYPTGDTDTAVTTTLPTDTGTVPVPRPVLCPPPDLEICGNGIDDNGDGHTDCAIERFGAPRLFASVSMSSTALSSAHEVFAPGDLTGDGVVDLAVFENGIDGVSRVASLALPLSDGASAPTAGGQIAAEAWSAHTPRFGDYDGDGTLDVVLGLRLSDLLVCDDERPWVDALVRFPTGTTIDAQGSAWSTLVKPSTLMLSPHAIYVYAAGDIDGDGLLEHSAVISDCVTGTTQYLVRGSSLAGEQELSAAASWWMETAANYQPSRTHDIGDINGDGVDDLAWTTYPVSVVAGMQTSKTSIWTTLPPEGAVDPATADYTILAPGFVRSISTAHDLSLDGAPDLVFAVDYGSAPGIYVVDGPPLLAVMDLTTDAWSSYPIPAVGSQALSASTGDLNADGYADLVIGVNGDGVYIDYAPCVGVHGLPVDGFTAVPANQFVLVDVDGDGHLDIAWPEEDGNVDVVQGGPQ